MPGDFTAALSHRVLVCDGAMGTLLHAGGVSLDRSLPELNLTRPELVQAIHRAYLDVGVDILQTNTFGANRLALARFGDDDRVAEINLAGAQIARQAAIESGAEVWIAGSVGPASPVSRRGMVSAAALQETLREQLQALADGGVDLWLFETFGDLRELTAAIEIAREIARLPVIAQMTFADDGRTIAGNAPEEVTSALESLQVDVLGVNCTLGPQGVLEVLQKVARRSSTPLSAQPNAGLPQLADGHFRYRTDEGYFARYARHFVEIGAVVVGGCCGTTPVHLEAVVNAVRELPPVARRLHREPDPHAVQNISPPTSTEGSDLAARLAAGQFVVACELQPPVGGDPQQAVRDAELLQAAGAQAIVVSSTQSLRAQLSPVAVALLVQRAQIETILTVTTWDKSIMALQADLLGAYALGIRNVLCSTGTPPQQGAYPNASGIWDVDSLGLMQVLGALNEGRDHNGIAIGRPTSFFVGARVNPAAEDLPLQVERARHKIDAGAQFLITTPVYELDSLSRLREALGSISVPLLLGVLPLQDFRHGEYLQHEVPGMFVPEPVLQRLSQAGVNGPEVGVELAREVILAARDQVQGILVASRSSSAPEMAQVLRALPG